MSNIIVMNKEEVEVLFDKMFTKYLSSDKKDKEVNEGEVLHSIKELADFMHCSIGTAQKRKNDNAIPYTQHGRKIQFVKSEVSAALKKNNIVDRKRKAK